MASIEPIRFVAHANVQLLLQDAMDDLIPRPDAAELHAAAPQPKDMRWYDARHNLNHRAVADRLRWLQEQIGLDAQP